MRVLLSLTIASVFAVSINAQSTKRWRTPWGDPDLEGSWSNATTTPLQRPAKYGNREFLTREERAQQDKDTSIGTDRRITSDSADFDAKADTALFTGNVLINQQRNVLQGQRLFIDRKAGNTRQWIHQRASGSRTGAS